MLVTSHKRYTYWLVTGLLMWTRVQGRSPMLEHAQQAAMVQKAFQLVCCRINGSRAAPHRCSQHAHLFYLCSAVNGTLSWPGCNMRESLGALCCVCLLLTFLLFSSTQPSGSEAGPHAGLPADQKVLWTGCHTHADCAQAASNPWG